MDKGNYNNNPLMAELLPAHSSYPSLNLQHGYKCQLPGLHTTNLTNGHLRVIIHVETRSSRQQVVVVFVENEFVFFLLSQVGLL